MHCAIQHVAKSRVFVSAWMDWIWGLFLWDLTVELLRLVVHLRYLLLQGVEPLLRRCRPRDFRIAGGHETFVVASISKEGDVGRKVRKRGAR
jgi:hypothetical protein